MKIEQFRSYFKHNEAAIINELNELMKQTIADGKAATNCVPNDKYQFAWGTLKKELKKNGYVYDDAMIYKVRDEKEVQELKNEIETLKNRLEDQKMENIKEDTGIQKMLRQMKDKTSKDDMSSISVRMPKSAQNRIDKMIEGTNYSKNQFIVDAVLNALDELEKELVKDGE